LSIKNKSEIEKFMSVPVPAETPEVRKKHIAKVISYTLIPDYVFEKPLRKDGHKRT